MDCFPPKRHSAVVHTRVHQYGQTRVVSSLELEKAVQYKYGVAHGQACIGIGQAPKAKLGMEPWKARVQQQQVVGKYTRVVIDDQKLFAVHVRACMHMSVIVQALYHHASSTELQPRPHACMHARLVSRACSRRAPGHAVTTTFTVPCCSASFRFGTATGQLVWACTRTVCAETSLAWLARAMGCYSIYAYRFLIIDLCTGLRRIDHACCSIRANRTLCTSRTTHHVMG